MTSSEWYRQHVHRVVCHTRVQARLLGTWQSVCATEESRRDARVVRLCWLVDGSKFAVESVVPDSRDPETIARDIVWKAVDLWLAMEPPNG